MADFLGTVFRPLTDLIGGGLEVFHSLGAPWWLSIALLTILVRLALSPLTVKQVRNLRTMQALKPEMEEIRTRHKDDREKQQKALMELYRERRVNPVAGFLPLLVQMPIFITMYHVVRDHGEHLQSFASGGLLWFSDLTRADPLFILPVLSASLMIAAGEISARNTSPGQRRMMRLMPVVFTAFIVRFPAGIFIYWVTSNTVTLVQNYLIYHRSPVRDTTPSRERAPAEGLALAAAAPLSSAPAQTKRKPGSRRRRKKSKR